MGELGNPYCRLVVSAFGVAHAAWVSVLLHYPPLLPAALTCDRTQVLLTDRFAEGLMLLRNIFRWHMIDLSYISLNETNARMKASKKNAKRKGSEVRRPTFDELSIQVPNIPYLVIFCTHTHVFTENVTAGRCLLSSRRPDFGKRQRPCSVVPPFARLPLYPLLQGTGRPRSDCPTKRNIGKVFLHTYPALFIQ